MRVSSKYVIVSASSTYDCPENYSVDTVIGNDKKVKKFSQTGQNVTIEVDGASSLMIYIVKQDGGTTQEADFDAKVDRVCQVADLDMVSNYASQAVATEQEKYKYAGCKTYTECKNLGFTTEETFQGNLMSLEMSGGLFATSTVIRKFDSSLPSLENGNSMFYECSSLSSFKSNTPMLSNAQYMFCDCTSLTSFSGDIPALTDGSYMFYGCNRLISFSGDLSSLTNGSNMFNVLFKYVNRQSGIVIMYHGILTSFSSDLPKLSNGSNMFSDCKLNKPSVLRILNSIPTHTSGSHTLTLGIQYSLKSDSEIGDNGTAIINARNKGWTVAVSYNS